MAGGLLRDRYGERSEVRSAGTEPSGVQQMAVEVMREIGIDISEHESEYLHTYAGRPHDIVVTVCDDAAQRCPYLAARKQNLHRRFEDPSSVKGTADEKRVAIRRVRDELVEWIEEPFATVEGE